MDKKNWTVVLILVAAVAILAVLGLVLPGRNTAKEAAPTVTAPDGAVTTLAPEDTPVPEETAVPENTAVPEKTAGTAGEARAWLLITVDDKTYAPMALTKAGDYTVTQKKKGCTNVIHVTEDSVQMASSTCDNQLCVGEGVVTLENKATRILGNYILCLPNGVTLELLNQEEYQAYTEGKRQ